ncbi:dynein regulatory complex protein 1-like [Diabrotica virgifera virgifera]|uniref:Dynein regulatory complex protein 1-like n=1 Tax=Diabrotica virgifera virgifera TaxID=50390 RepID=A0A6P7F6D7_DIAVI|nr:dynein regulatory complex protein 1-like [Diabrotica virgifera virgifera]
MGDTDSIRCGDPRIDSDDPKERKFARRLRIKRRVELQKRQDLSIVDKTTHIAEKPVFDEEYQLIYKQKQKSDHYLERRCIVSKASLNHRRQIAFKRELDKRIDSDTSKNQLIKEIEEEARQAQNKFEEIAVKWSLIKKFKDPYNIQEMINVQKGKCDDIIRQKDAIIATLKNKIKGAEIEYTKEQQKQTEEVNDLTKRIQKQLDLLKKAYQRQIKIISLTIKGLTKKFVQAKNYKWEDLHQNMCDMEAPQSEAQFRALEDFQEKMMSIHEGFEEDFRTRKFELVGIIDAARQEMEHIKVASLYNSEKLDYNYQILSRRQDENILLKGQQKRRINKLQDVITEMRHKLSSYKETTNNNIKKTTEMISKIHQRILEIEARADHISKVNESKFNKLWEINKKHCLQVLEKIMDIDKVLHHQQMAKEWVKPEQIFLEYSSMASFRRAHILLYENPPTDSETKTLDESLIDFNLAPTVFYKNLLKKILGVLSDKGGFLTESRLKSLITQYKDDKRHLVRLDHIFDALDLNTSHRTLEVIPFFLPYCYCLFCAHLNTPEHSLAGTMVSSLSVGFNQQHTSKLYNANILPLEEAIKMTQESKIVIENAVEELLPGVDFSDISTEDDISIDGVEADESDSILKRKSMMAKKRIQMKDLKDRTVCQFHHPLVISRIYVIKALNEFIEFYHQKSNPIPTTGERLQKRRYTISRLLDDEDISEYWKRITSVYSEERFKVWDALLKGLKHYHEILKERKAMAKEVVELKKINERLSNQLAKYQDHHVLLPPILCSLSVRNK